MIKNKRDKCIRVITEFATTRPYTLIMILALLCTLIVKLHYASQTREYLSWVMSDISFLCGVEVVLALLCFWGPKIWAVRLATVIAAVVCLWSFLNAGWLIRTGTQILPWVLSSVVHGPINAILMVGENLSKVPITAVLLVVPGTLTLFFFFYVLAKPKIPKYNRKRFFIRYNLSIIICFAAITARPALIRNKPSQPVSLELRYNAQLKALTSLIFNHNNPAPVPTRLVPFYDQLKVPTGPHMSKNNIIVIVLEGVQYEQTSLGKNTLDLTPYLANLGKRGITFTNARSTLTHTTKTLFSLLTGRFPSASQDTIEAVPAEKTYAGLPTILHDQLGYRTAFFQSAMGNFECRPGLVYNLGFDKFWARDDLNDPNKYLGYLASDEFAIIKPIANWIKSDTRPFLITIMCSVTHDTYDLPKQFGEQPKEDIERYRKTIAYTDKFLSAFETEMDNIGIMDNTIFCVIGDHGEAFKEHGMAGHDRITYEEVLHVPFFLKAPSIEPRVISNPVSSIDLTPTLLGLLGFQTEKAGFDGANVLEPVQNDRKVYFSGWMYEGQSGYVQGNYKYVYDFLHQLICYYDLETDPNEQVQIEIPDDKKQAFIDEIEGWREDSIFQYDQEYKGKKLLYDHWLCKWGNRHASAKYVTLEEGKVFLRRSGK